MLSPVSATMAVMSPQPRVASVNVGEIASLPHGRTSVQTAIRKHPVEGPVALGSLGFTGDHQADTRNHGGPDKAVLLFSLEQYPSLARHIGHEISVPSFGENLTIAGTTEESVCIGDVIRIGTATLEVNQPRNPCYKQAALHQVRDLVLEVERTGATGWYARVLEPGEVTAGDDVTLIDRPFADVTVASVNGILHPPDDSTFDHEQIGHLLTIPALAGRLRDRLEHLSRNEIEDPSRRRRGPTD